MNGSSKKPMSLMFAAFLLVFYLVIVLYVFFAVLEPDSVANFWTGLSFEALGFLLTCWLIMGSMAMGNMKIGFLAPLIGATVIYTLVVNVLNFLLMNAFSHVFFLLVHLVVLFVYCLVSIPLYYMGRR